MGSLVFFDTEEHQISNKVMAQIPKLGSQWRIIHDFKPTEYLQAANPATKSLFLESGDSKTPGSIRVDIYFPLPKIAVVHVIRGDNDQPQGKYIVKSTQLPKVGEWTRVEIGHEKVDEKYFLSLSVGGREVGRVEVTNPELRKLTDVRVSIGHPDEKHCQAGFIRRLVVLEKR